MSLTMEEIRSNLNRYGIARSNRFRVTIHNVNRLLESRYKYDGDDDNQVPERLQFMCEMTELPTKQLNLTTSRFRKMPTEQVFDNLPITFKIGADGLERRIFDLWMAYIIDLYSDYVEYQVDYTTNIDIELLDHRARTGVDKKLPDGKIDYAIEEKPVYKITLVDAFPMTVGATQLQSTVGGDYMTQSVTFAYRFWDIIKIDSQGNPKPKESLNVGEPQLQGLTGLNLPKAKEAAKVGFDLKTVTAKITKTLDTTKGLLSLNQGETLNLYNKVNDFFTKNTGLSVNEAKRWTEQTKRDVESITNEDVLSNANKVVLVGGLANILGLLPKP